MHITDIRIKKVSNPTGNIKAYATIVLDDELAVHGIKILEGDTGLFIAMPSKQKTGDKYIDIVHPINTATRNKISEAILDAYQKS